MGASSSFNVAAALLFEDDGVIVVNKPAGMPTAGDTLHEPGSLQFELMRHHRRMVWAVHQLDRDTSGVNLFVTRKKLVQPWVEKLQAGTKSYLAVCDGVYEGGEVEAPLGWVSRGVRGVTPDGKYARTTFRPVRHGPCHTLLEAQLHTGKTHQIRIHLAHVGHPIAGDVRYGGSVQPIGQQLLHAWRLQIGATLFEAPPPTDFEEYSRALTG